MKKYTISLILVGILLSNHFLISQESMDKQLKGFDQRMNKIMTDWNAVGCAVGIVKGNKLIYAKGFGYRDLEKNLPVTPNTLFMIISDTKLFTATSVGLLVNDGLLEWDKPIKQQVPSIQFYNDQLNASATLRDMLSHRTGIPYTWSIFYGSSYTRKELFQRLVYLKPITGIREKFLYNNMMYMAAGEIIEIKTGEKWEDFVKEKILQPLEMKNTIFSIEDMRKTEDFAKPYYSNIVTKTSKPVSFNSHLDAMGPAVSIISNVNDLSNWVICQLNKGKFKNQEIIPATVIKETFVPESFTDWYYEDEKELSFGLYGMGRGMNTYKGHLMTEHGGIIQGFLSQITLFPDDELGIIILTNSSGHGIADFLSYEIADRLLNLSPTQWHERRLEKLRKAKEEEIKAEIMEDKDYVKNTSPSHELKDFAGEYENPAWGNVIIKLDSGKLYFHFRIFDFPLQHIHYDQFKTPAGENYGKFRISFLTNSKGDIETLIMPLDEADIYFKKKVN